MRTRFSIGVLLVATGFLAVAPNSQHLLLVLLTSTAIYLGYRLQLGSNET